MKRSFALVVALLASVAIVSVQIEDGPALAEGGFVSLSKPERFLDTRASGVRVGDESFDGVGSYELQVTGRLGVPSGVSAVAMNLTVTGSSTGPFGGYATVYPCGSVPDSSNLNFVDGQTIANSVVAPLSSSGKVCVAVFGLAHVIVDISGYLSGTPGSGTVNEADLISFDFGNAVAVGLASSAQTRSGIKATEGGTTNLLAVSATGSVEPAITSGELDVSEFLVAPSGKLYALLAGRQQISETDASGCLLIEIDTANDSARCVDSTLSSINWSTATTRDQDAIQFDDSGRIYFDGYSEDGKAVLRRYDNGDVTDLINDNISIHGWLVLDDGRVLVTGQTTSTGLEWIRVINEAGGLSTLSGERALFFEQFPDGDVYFGIWNCSTISDCGVYRYLTDEARAEMSDAYISGDINALDQLPGYNPTFDASTICEGYGLAGGNPFCGWYGTTAASFVTTLSQDVYALPGGSGNGEPWQYYPVVDRLSTQVETVTGMQAILDDLLLTGTNSLSQQVLVVHDTGTGNETALLDGSAEIEIYNMEFDAAENQILFDGLRFADNKYVVGFIDVASREVTASILPGGKLESFAKLG